MSLKSKLVSSYLAFDDHLDDNSPIHDIRKKAIDTFEEKGFPTKKEEDWKYTSLNAIINKDYSISSKGDKEIKYAASMPFALNPEACRKAGAQ